MPKCEYLLLKVLLFVTRVNCLTIGSYLNLKLFKVKIFIVVLCSNGLFNKFIKLIYAYIFH